MMTQQLPKIDAVARYTTTQAATLLGVHRNTLHRYIVSGRLKAIIRRADNRVLVKGSDLITFWIYSY